MIELLVRYGADVNPVPNPPSLEELSRLYPTVRGDGIWIVEVLTRDAAPETSPLHLAAIYDQIRIVEVLLKRGAKIESKDRGGLTPLHLAAKWGNVRIVKLLLKHSARVDNREDHIESLSAGPALRPSMNTVLHTAAGEWGPKAEIVALLLEAGADPNAKNASKESPLDLAKWFAQTGDQPTPSERRRAAEADLCIRLLYRYGGEPSKPQK
jgi:hypothetical protein